MTKFSLQWYSSDNKWSLWYIQENKFSILKRTCSSSKSRNKIYFSSDSCLVWFWVSFHRPSQSLAHLSALAMILVKYKQLPGFPVWNKTTLRKWCWKLGFCYDRVNKNASVFVKNVTQALSFEFCEFFQSAI